MGLEEEKNNINKNDETQIISTAKEILDEYIIAFTELGKWLDYL